MNLKIDALIRDYKREKEPFLQMSILVAVRNELDLLSKALAKKIK